MAKDEISRAISKVSEGAGVLLLTDMFGGTPTNISAMFIKENEVENRNGREFADGHQTRFPNKGNVID